MYKWICAKCGKAIKWDGKGEKPDTSCIGSILKKHNRIQMPLKGMPKK